MTSDIHFISLSSNIHLRYRLERLGNTENPITQLSVSTNDNCWPASGLDSLVSFIATSSQLHTVYLEGEPGSIKACPLRKCAIAACSNSRVNRVRLRFALTRGHVESVTDVLLIVGAKVKELCLVQENPNQSIEKDKMELLNATIASLGNLETTWLMNLSEEVFLDMMTSLAKRKSSNLKEIDIRSFSATEFPGIDSFLSSYGASSLKCLRASYSDSGDAAMRSIASGLVRCSSIESLDLSVSQMSLESAEVLAKYLTQGHTNLKELSIANENPESSSTHIQEAIFTALYNNTSIRRLRLGNGFFFAACEESISELLIRNSYIEHLVCDCERVSRVLCNPWIQSLADGIYDNSTLKHLDMSYCMGHNCDIQPLLDSLLSTKSGIETLELGVLPTIDQGNAVAIAYTINNPLCQLKCLNLTSEINDDEFLQLLSGIQESSSLRSLAILNYSDEVRRDTWTNLCPFLANLPIKKLEIEFEEISMAGSDMHSIHEEILQYGMRLNKSLESARIIVGRSDNVDNLQYSFHSKVNEYCNRNVAAKAINALVKGELPLASLPHVLEALRKRSGYKEEVASSLLFSVLQKSSPNSELWQSLAQSKYFEEARPFKKIRT